jgi:GH24 family phage-related lysozyme (muramidase)
MCRATYRDSGGVWPIGIGHTKGVHEGMVITRDQVDQFFAEHQAPLFVLVKDKSILAAAAMISFGFNCGREALEEYLLGKIRLARSKVYNHGAIVTAWPKVIHGIQSQVDEINATVDVQPTIDGM